MQRYPNISDHGLIGDLQAAALATTDGTIDWFCTPRFDSPSVFASLLDADKGGYCRIAPETSEYVSRQRRSASGSGTGSSSTAAAATAPAL
ncbi:MAG TPA: trehalase-like domain-containing protein [Streptosporangiaceae bacterium]|nr:trehalase-like domain-containing protein [Streptosporangiaceae bacterium]